MEKKLCRKKEKCIADGNRLHLATTCRALADFYNQQGHYNKALSEYKNEAQVYSKLGKKLDMAKAHRMASEMYMLLSEFDSALNHASIYYKVVKSLSNKIEEQRAHATIGRIHLLNGQSVSDVSSALRSLKNAEKSFIQSLLICKDLTNQVSRIELLDMQARLYLNIGVAKEHMEEYEEAMSYMEKAIKISKANDLYELLHLCYMSASLMYQKKEDTTLSLRFCNLAHEVAKRLPNRAKKECETLLVKSEVMIKVGDFQSAKQVLHKAYKLKSPDCNDHENITRNLKIVAALSYTLDALVTVSSIDYPAKKKLYEKMGDGCCVLQNFPKAIEYYLKMLECAELGGEPNKELIPIYVSLYQTYKDNKQYDSALEYLWKEFEFNKEEPVEAFHTLCNIGEVCELQNKPFWTIQDVYQKAINEAEKMNNSRFHKIGLVRLMKLQKKFNMNNLAEDLRETAKQKGIDLTKHINDDSDDDDNASNNTEQNTPDIGEDICLDDLTDSESESDNSEKPRQVRKRGTCLTVKRNDKGETQLHQACISGNLELARRLIDQGHTVNVRDHAGWLPLHEACNHGYRDIVELLLDKGSASAINDKGGTSCDGITPLYDACSNGFLDVVEILLERGANVTLRTDFGDTALNILDKWRSTADLNVFELAQYSSIRESIVNKLKNSGTIVSPHKILTPNRSDKSLANKDENYSLDKLRKFAFDDSNSENSGDETLVSQDHEYNPYEESFSKTLREYNAKTSPYKMQKSTTAKEEYKNVMQNLKHPYRPQIVDNKEENRFGKRRPGFLKEDEVDEDWLDEDMKPNNKKRKYISDRTLYGVDVGNEKPSDIFDTRISISLPNDNECRDFNDTLLNCNDNIQSGFYSLPSTSNVVRPPIKKPKTSISSSFPGRKRSSKGQTSLLESGFCRFQRESDESSIDSIINTEPDSTTMNSILLTPTKSVTTLRRVESNESLLPTQLPIISFKIKVEDELLLVPVERKKIAEANIRWLAEEAARRYYNTVGLKPVLRLMTSDGFAFEETDIVSVALNETMITSKVLEWKKSPLTQRYEEICNQLNLDVDLTIRSVLEKSEASNTLILAGYELTPDITQPVFVSLLHQSTLRIIDLSNNFIQDEGCKQLSKSLPTLKQLRTLNLRGNCLTGTGLGYLLEATTSAGSSGLSELEDLCLSYNPLGNESIRILDKFCRNLSKLKKLDLASCEITNFYNFDLRFYELTEIDVSFNSLSGESFKSLLAKLNSCRLEILNLAFTCGSGSSGGGQAINLLFENGTCEKFKFIDLSGCNLIDSDIYNLAQHLSKAKNLEKLNLTDNQKLSFLSLQYILDKLGHTKKLIMQQCAILFDQNFVIKFNQNVCDHVPEFLIFTISNDIECDIDEQINNLKSFWQLNWNERAKILMRGGTHIYLYVNDCDVL